MLLQHLETQEQASALDLWKELVIPNVTACGPVLLPYLA